jgi:Outer membrane receptor for ferrienterochelin and colicins
MSLKKALPLAAALLAVGASPLMAQNGADEQTLAEVQVTRLTGQFDNPPFTEQQKATATNNIVYDKTALEMSSAEVLSDFLAEQGIGVFKSPTDYGHTLLTIRGFRTDHLSKELDGHVLFLIDGRRTGTNNPTQVPLVNVERVEILRGPEMLKYSAAAAGGVINVVTKKGGPDKLAGSLEAGFGSYDFKKGSIKLNGLVEGFDYSLGYQYSERGNYKDGRGDRIYHSETDGINSMVANLGYTFNERHRIGWSTYYYAVDNAYRPSYTDYVDNVVYGPSYTDRKNISNTLSYEGGTEDERFTWQAGYTFGENWSKQYALGEKGHPMAAKFDRDVFDASLTYHGDMVNLTGGFQYLDYDTEEGTATSNTNPGNKLAPTGRFQNTAGFLNGDLKLLEDTLILSASIRYDHYKVSDKMQDLTKDLDGFPPGTKLPWSRNFNHLSHSLGVSYLPLDWLKLRANYTNSMRPPSPRELTSGSYEPYNYWGNPWNKAETTDTYEAGFDVNLQHASFSATYFWSDTEDYVYQHQDPDFPHNRVQNTERQIRQGIEMQLSGNLAGALGYDNFELRPYINYSHLFNLKEQYRKGETRYGLGNWYNAYANRIPKTTIAAGIRFQYPDQQLKVNLNLNYWGKVLYDARTSYTDRNGNFIPYNPNLKYGGFTVANLSIRKGIWDFGDKGNLELKVDVNNLFDKDYAFGDPNDRANNAHMQGRNYYVGVAYNF